MIWSRLKSGKIVGIVDSNGAARSEFTGDVSAFHADFFPACHCHWRWDSDQGIWWISSEHKPDAEQMEAIMNHLTKKYGIRWLENGFHDMEHLESKWREEQPEEN
jgi:hypothetical protein